MTHRSSSLQKEFLKLRKYDEVADAHAHYKTSMTHSHLNRYSDILANESTLFPSVWTPRAPTQLSSSSSAGDEINGKNDSNEKDNENNNGSSPNVDPAKALEGPSTRRGQNLTLVLGQSAADFASPPNANGAASGLFPYLNANYFSRDRFYEAPHAFVAAQAPVPAQFPDFWRTIAFYDVPLIIMLTQEVEGSRRKAHTYWPSAPHRPTHLCKGSVLELTAEAEDTDLAIVRRTITLTQGTGPSATVHTVQQLHYHGWPDFGVPGNTKSFDALVEAITTTAPARGPIIVHCSAGVGRTGTLMAVYYAQHLQRATGTKITRGVIHDIVARMKQTRTGMVQRPEQLGYIYTCMGIS